MFQIVADIIQRIKDKNEKLPKNYHHYSLLILYLDKNFHEIIYSIILHYYYTYECKDKEKMKTILPEEIYKSEKNTLTGGQLFDWNKLPDNLKLLIVVYLRMITDG